MTDDTEITTVIVAADLHINSTVAVAPPTINLDDGGTYRSSRTQRWLWDCWLDFCDQTSQLPGRKVVILNGDLGELDTKRRSNQIITANKATILSLGTTVLERLVGSADKVYVIRGTAAHTGKSAWLEEAIAQDFDNTVPQSDGISSWWHLRAAASGVRFDAAHHASMGGLPWTEKNAAHKVASIICWRYMVDLEQKPPHIALRSHNHRRNDSGDNFKVRAILTPAWTTATEFVYRIGKENDLAHIGGMAFICQDGTYELRNYSYAPREARQVWKLQM